MKSASKRTRPEPAENSVTPKSAAYTQDDRSIASDLGEALVAIPGSPRMTAQRKAFDEALGQKQLIPAPALKTAPLSDTTQYPVQRVVTLNGQRYTKENKEELRKQLQTDKGKDNQFWGLIEKQVDSEKYNYVYADWDSFQKGQYTLERLKEEASTSGKLESPKVKLVPSSSKRNQELKKNESEKKGNSIRLKSKVDSKVPLKKERAEKGKKIKKVSYKNTGSQQSPLVEKYLTKLRPVVDLSGCVGKEFNPQGVSELLNMAETQDTGGLVYKTGDTGKEHLKQEQLLSFVLSASLNVDRLLVVAGQLIVLISGTDPVKKLKAAALASRIIGVVSIRGCGRDFVERMYAGLGQLLGMAEDLINKKEGEEVEVNKEEEVGEEYTFDDTAKEEGEDAWLLRKIIKVTGNQLNSREVLKRVKPQANFQKDTEDDSYIKKLIQKEYQNILKAKEFQEEKEENELPVLIKKLTSDTGVKDPFEALREAISLQFMEDAQDFSWVQTVHWSHFHRSQKEAINELLKATGIGFTVDEDQLFNPKSEE